LTPFAIFLGGVIVVELVAIVARRNWVHWKVGERQVLVDEAITVLADAVVAQGEVESPQGRVDD
jgi:hypothetical protein